MNSTFPNSRFILNGLVGLISLVLLPSGCTLGPDFMRPAAPAVKTYTSAASPQPYANTVAAQSFASGKDIPGEWWILFRSRPLNQLIEQAIQHSPNLQAAQAALLEAQETLYAREGSLLPAFDASGLVRRQKISGALFGNPNRGGALFTIYDASVSVSYSLDVFGGIRREIEGLTALADLQRFQLQAAYLTLTSNIVTAAISEASLREQIAVTEEIIRTQSQQLDLINLQLGLGTASQLDSLAQQSALEQTRASLPPLQRLLALTRHRLSVLAGQFPSEPILAQFNLSDLHLPQELPLSLPSKLVEQRPDVLAQESQLHAASAQIGVATANLLPNFTLSAGASSIATQAGDLFMPGSAFWNTGANLLQPIFHGGELIHKRRAAVAAFKQAAAQYRFTVLYAFQNVADVLRALESDANELATQEAALQVAAEAWRLSREQITATINSRLHSRFPRSDLNSSASPEMRHEEMPES